MKQTVRSAAAPGLIVAARALLETPLMSEDHEDFRDTWKWRRELQALYAELTGWTVETRPGLLRLSAAAPFPDAGRATAALESPRAASLFAWTLWYHEALGARIGEVRQFTLEELAGAVGEASGIDFLKRSDRTALQQALRTLENLGALRVVDAGTGIDTWLEGTVSLSGEGSRLFEFTILAPYLVAPGRPAEPTPAQRAARALLTGPALSRARDPEAYAALSGTYEHLESSFGWNVDVQGDHASLLRDTQPEKGHQRVPQGRSARSAAGLLLAEAVRLADEDGMLERDLHNRVLISSGQLYGLMDAVREEYRNRWGQFGQKNTERHLSEILEDWRTLGALSEWPGVPDGYALEPHLARLRARYLNPQKTPESQKDPGGLQSPAPLFDQE